jgi:hypothetical protein
VQLCIVHLVRAALKYVMDKDSRAVAGDLKKIYQSATVGEAEAELEKFAEVWGVKYPTIVKQWRRKWTALIALFEFPPAIRKAIYTTHAIESVNSVIRKFTRNRKQYPNAESALKLVYLAIHEAARRWTMPIVGWKAARNPFAIVFEDRLPHCSKNGPPNPIPTQLTQKNIQTPGRRAAAHHPRRAGAAQALVAVDQGRRPVRPPPLEVTQSSPLGGPAGHQRPRAGRQRLDRQPAALRRRR